MKCIIFGCGRSAKTRGLCGPCYQAARAKVKKGAVEWGTLERLDMASPPTRVGGRPEGPFETLFKKKVTDNEVHD